MNTLTPNAVTCIEFGGQATVLFGFKLPGGNAQFQTSPDLVNWTTVQTTTGKGNHTFTALLSDAVWARVVVG